MQTRIILTVFTLLFSLLTNAQTYTISGHINNLMNNGVAGLTLTLNTPIAETTLTDAEGFFSFTTMQYPTGINDLAENSGGLAIYPNPTTSLATVLVPDKKGQLEVFNSHGQLLKKANVANETTIRLNTPGNVFLLRFVANNGEMWNKKLMADGGLRRLNIVKQNYLKSAVQDTFSYQLAIAGNVGGNRIDTSVTISGFAQNQNSHSQDFIIDTKQVFLYGRTFAIGSGEEGFYDINDSEYLASRAEQFPVTLISQDGTQTQEILADEQGNFQAIINKPGMYFALIPENEETHPAIQTIIANDITNKQNISAYDKEGSMWNLLQTQFRYNIVPNKPGELTPPPPGEARMIIWNPELEVPGVLNHIIMNKVYDEETNTFTDEDVSQAQIDTVLAVRKKLDNILNDFYKKGNTIITDDAYSVPVEKRTHFHYFINLNAGGTYGMVEKNGMIDMAFIGVNIAVWDQGRIQYQENGSVKARGELQNADKRSILDAGTSEKLPQSDDRRNLEYNQIRGQELTQQGIPEKGIYAGDIHPLALEQGHHLPEIEDHITSFAPVETLEELQKYQSGEKSANTTGKDVYKMTIGILDLEGNITSIKRVDASNFEEALKNKEIPGLYKSEIKELFLN